MPKIPMYNKGLGPSVLPATGKLSSGYSLQSVQSLVNAHGKLADTIGQVADVAANFEKTIQLEEAEKRFMEYSSSIRDNYLQLNSQPFENLSDYEAEERNLRTKIMDEVGGMDLSPAQKRFLKDKANKSANVLAVDGRKKTYDRFIQTKGDLNDSTIDGVFDDYAAGTLDFNTAFQQASKIHEASALKGFPSKYTKEGLKYEGLKRGLDIRVNQQGLSLDKLRTESEDIMARRGVYAGLELEEAEALASIVENKIEYLSTGESVKAQRTLDNGIAMAVNGDLGAFAEIDSAINTFELLNMPKEAQDAKDKRATVGAVARAFNGIGGLDLASEAEIAESRKAFEKQYENEPALKAAFLELYDAQAKEQKNAIATDPYGYVASRYEARHGERISAVESVRLQRKLGVSENNIKFTSSENLENYANAMMEAETVTELMGVMDQIKIEARGTSLMTSSELAELDTLVTRNMFQQGIPVESAFIINMPSSEFSRKMINSKSIDFKERGFTPTKLTQLEAAVRNDPVVAEHISSMGDFPGAEAVGDSHVQMIMRMVAQDMKKAGADPTEKDFKFGEYISANAQLFSERYTYYTYQGSTLRLSNTYNPVEQSVVMNHLKLAADAVRLDGTVNSALFKGFPAGAASQYMEELKDGASFITVRGDKAVRLVDANGAPVQVVAVGPDGKETVTFVDILISELAKTDGDYAKLDIRARIDLLDDDRKAAELRLKNEFGGVKLKAGQPGYEERLQERDRLKEQIKNIETQIGNLSQYAKEREQ